MALGSELWDSFPEPRAPACAASLVPSPCATGRPNPEQYHAVKYATSCAGFSLIELFIVMSLVGIFFSAVYESVIIGLRTVNASDERENIRFQLARALDQLTREASVASNVDSAQDQRLQIDADLDGNGSTENNVNYQVQNGDLERVYNGATVVLVPDLTSLDFDYVDLNGTAMTTPVGSGSLHDIRIVQITATVTKDQETVSLTSAVYLRNNQ